MTKQELETRVAELEAQLAGITAVGTTPPISVGISSEDLDAAIASVKDEWTRKLTESEKLRAEDNLAAAGVISKMKSELEASKNRPAAGKQDGVILLDGVPHRVVQRERMYDMVEAWRRRFVEDDALTLVVEKA